MNASSPTLTAGNIISNDRSFTAPTGTHFMSGERFAVEIVGRSTRCRHIGTGSVVWVQGSARGSAFLSVRA